MKVRLLNDGGYGDMKTIKFPAIVEGDDYKGIGCRVLGSELVRVGASTDEGLDLGWKYFFRYGIECEVINER